MKFINKLTVLSVALAGLIVASSLHADTFNFSYTFADGAVVTGAFDGTSDGSFITNISDVSFNVDGTAFLGAITPEPFDTSLSSVALVSFNGDQNNFSFSNPDFVGQLTFADGFAIALGGDPTTFHFDPSIDDTWSVDDTSTSSVPEGGATIAMLGFGTAGLGCLWGRKLRSLRC